MLKTLKTVLQSTLAPPTTAATTTTNATSSPATATIGSEGSLSKYYGKHRKLLTPIPVL